MNENLNMCEACGVGKTAERLRAENQRARMVSDVHELQEKIRKEYKRSPKCPGSGEKLGIHLGDLAALTHRQRYCDRMKRTSNVTL